MAQKLNRPAAGELTLFFSMIRMTAHQPNGDAPMSRVPPPDAEAPVPLSHVPSSDAEAPVQLNKSAISNGFFWTLLVASSALGFVMKLIGIYVK